MITFDLPAFGSCRKSRAIYAGEDASMLQEQKSMYLQDPLNGSLWGNLEVSHNETAKAVLDLYVDSMANGFNRGL